MPGVDYYGSFLGIKNNYVINAYLYVSIFAFRRLTSTIKRAFSSIKSKCANCGVVFKSILYFLLSYV